MNIDQEWVCGNLKYSTQKTQYKRDTLKDTWQRDKKHSRKIFNFRHTVLLIGVREPAAIV